jgi:hypothetical protein
MATNPRIPDRNDVPTLEDQRRKKPASPLVPLGILVAALLLIALIVWLPRTPRATAPPSAADVPPQPTGSQIQLSEYRMVPAPIGDQLYIYARLFNAGTTSINGVRAQVRFAGPNGQAATPIVAPVEAVDNTGAGRNLVDLPVPPNDSREIRINVEHVPSGWNHQLPAIQLDTVTSTGAK